MEDCLFCKIVAGEIPAQIVYADARTIAFMDIAPASRGHCLVAPRAHTNDLLTADPVDVAACAVAAQELARRAYEDLGAAGVNILQSSGEAAWQSVFHLHFHVIPRYPDDGLTIPAQPYGADADEIAAAATALREGTVDAE
ncbi:MAG: HIT family protein [Gaiellales bacterium]